ncbi:hypothetical protein ACJRO7_020394 [Eucalyptus globulus]|uniref:PGG domain-containing protein n=1 Tax=Eucalyptus globulus TaxID=34317 RepID=A0ABD3KI32_EUCGL
MERRMLEAARKGNIHELDDLISSNELIVKEMDLEGASHTPLHVACVAGHLDFLVEKVNADGFSLLHIVAAQGDVEIARELLTVGPHLCSMKGWERRVPLHYAAANGKVDVMKVLLAASPEFVEETIARDEIALHLAVKNNRFEAHKKEQVINWKDHKGNTALHLAAASKNFEAKLQVVNFLLCKHAVESEVVEVNAVNDSGSTPLDVSTPSLREARDREIREILIRAGAKHRRGRSNSPASSPVLAHDNDFGGGNSHQVAGEELVKDAPQSSPCSQSENSNPKNESFGDIRNALLVVTALIASATYQSKSITGANLVYSLFLGGNTLGFMVSVQMIICLTRFVPNHARLLLRLSLVTMILTYFCFTLSLLLRIMDKTGSDKKDKTGSEKKTLCMLPLMISFVLLLMQQWLACAIDYFLE